MKPRLYCVGPAQHTRYHFIEENWLFLSLQQMLKTPQLGVGLYAHFLSSMLGFCLTSDHVTLFFKLPARYSYKVVSLLFCSLSNSQPPQLAQ